MNERLWFLSVLGIACLWLLLGTHAGTALEVDSYHAWLVEIEDSSELINEFVTARFTEALEGANAKPRRFEACADVSTGLLRGVFVSVFGKKPIFRFVSELPGEYKFGGRHLPEVWRSQYRYVPQLYFSSLSEVLNVGGVYVGKDKISHIFGYGRRYHEHYRRLRDRGYDDEEALRTVIERGMEVESGWVGKRIDGIYSYADLEANYRGFEFARSLCAGGPLRIEGSSGQWRLVGSFDIRRLVTPRFDEGFNTPRYALAYWPGIRRRLRALCPLLLEPRVVDRLRRYREATLLSEHDELVERLSTDTQRHRRTRHSIFDLCKG